MNLSELMQYHPLEHVFLFEFMHFMFALLLGGLVFWASYRTLATYSDWDGRRTFYLSLLLAFPFASLSHYIADVLHFGF